MTRKGLAPNGLSIELFNLKFNELHKNFKIEVVNEDAKKKKARPFRAGKDLMPIFGSTRLNQRLERLS
jgi:hypothetical protein